MAYFTPFIACTLLHKCHLAYIHNPLLEPPVSQLAFQFMSKYFYPTVQFLPSDTLNTLGLLFV